MWVARFSDKQLEVLKALLRSEEHLGPALSRALESLELARWDDLPEASLPWDDVRKLAADQGISEADVVWDMSGHHLRQGAPAASPAKRTRRKARPAQPQ